MFEARTLARAHVVEQEWVGLEQEHFAKNESGRRMRVNSKENDESGGDASESAVNKTCCFQKDQETSGWDSEHWAQCCRRPDSKQ